MTPFPPRRYSILYVDPPWSFRVWNRDTGQGRSAEAHYRTMPLDAIKALPVQDIMAKDCAVFLWATMPMLPEGLDVLRAWNLRFVTVAFTWAKRSSTGRTWHTGLGYWTRANCEIVLLGVRGRMQRVSRAVPSLVVAPVGRHSAKPPEVRDRIVDLLGDLPRIELFARERAEGWDSWGNELDEVAA